MILIIGHPEDPHVKQVESQLKTLKQTVFLFNTSLFPTQTQVILRPDDMSLDHFKAMPGSREKIPLTEITAVFWRQHLGVDVSHITHPAQQAFAQAEVTSTVESFFHFLGGRDCRWVNSLEAYEQHLRKPYQLRLLQAIGLKIPQTLVSNNPYAVSEFYQSLKGNIITKPVLGTAVTPATEALKFCRRMTAEDLKPENLGRVLAIPATFQEYIPGVDIQAYVVGNEVFAAEVQSPEVDFRRDDTYALHPVTLPESVQKDCLKAARSLRQQFSLVDLRRTPDDDYVFIEANPAPKFLRFEEETRYPISQQLGQLLANNQI